jgi:hypothetical protein
MKTNRALLIVPAALLSATLAVAVPSWDLELTGLKELVPRVERMGASSDDSRSPTLVV